MRVELVKLYERPMEENDRGYGICNSRPPIHVGPSLNKLPVGQ